MILLPNAIDLNIHSVGTEIIYSTAMEQIAETVGLTYEIYRYYTETTREVNEWLAD